MTLSPARRPSRRVDYATLHDQTRVALRPYFPIDADVVELVTVFVNWRMVVSMVCALQIRLDGVLDLWPPDGRVPVA